MNVLPPSSKSAALLLAGCLLAGTSYAQSAASHAPTFDGTWSGTLSASKYFNHIGMQGCKYDVTNEVINVSKKTMQWKTKRAAKGGCTSPVFCKICPVSQDFSTRITISGNTITFFTPSTPTSATGHYTRMMTGTLDKTGNHITSKGQQADNHMTYTLRLHRVGKPPHLG